MQINEIKLFMQTANDNCSERDLALLAGSFEDE